MNIAVVAAAVVVVAVGVGVYAVVNDIYWKGFACKQTIAVDHSISADYPTILEAIIEMKYSY